LGRGLDFSPAVQTIPLDDQSGLQARFFALPEPTFLFLASFSWYSVWVDFNHFAMIIFQEAYPRRRLKMSSRKYFLFTLVLALVFFLCSAVLAQSLNQVPDPNKNWTGLPAAQARMAATGYKAAMGYVPLSKELNRILNSFWDSWPTRTDIPFVITYDVSSGKLFFQIQMKDDIRTLIWIVPNMVDIKYIRMNLSGENRRTLTIKNLWINGVYIGEYKSGADNRSWYFAKSNNSQIPFLTIIGTVNFSSAIGTITSHGKYPSFEFAFGNPQ
jgi:hypothetical protein